MDHEHPWRPSPCDHDDDVLCAHRFFDGTLRQHLDRRRLHAFIDGKRHWVFVVTPECLAVVRRLTELCAERCGEDGAPMLMTTLPMLPLFVCFPRDQLALEELADLVDFTQGSREAYEGRDFIVITTLNPPLLHRVVSQWVHVDHLLN
jgi:hypothetical protein